MRPVRLLAITVLSLSLVGCTTAVAGWTYAPVPSATPIPSSDASGSPSVAPSGSPAPSASASASSAPSASASTEPSASASASSSATVVTLSATAVDFDQKALTAPAGVAFQISFDNTDAGVPHDVVIHQGDRSGPEVFRGEVVTGPATKVYDVPALAAGSYGYVCSIHSNMVGTLTVQ